MKPYCSKHPKTGKPSNIVGYECTKDSITVYFSKGLVYTFTEKSCGKEHIDNMKACVDAKSGLQRYINTNQPVHFTKFKQ